MAQTWPIGGGVSQNPPVIDKNGKTAPPVRRSRTSPHRRAERAGKFLGFFKDFLGKI